MKQYISRVTLMVKDQEEALKFYTEVLNFRVLEDLQRSPTKRWLIIAPPGETQCALLVSKAKNERELATVGNQTGGRVFMFLYTDDFWRDVDHMKKHGVKFITEPTEKDFGKVVVFEDLYGNKWDFIEPNVK
ncbi:MAG: VOC family protein [Flavobacteriales bacterium]